MLTKSEFERIEYQIKEAALSNDEFMLKVSTVLDILAKFVSEGEDDDAA